MKNLRIMITMALLLAIFGCGSGSTPEPSEDPHAFQTAAAASVEATVEAARAKAYPGRATPTPNSDLATMDYPPMSVYLFNTEPELDVHLHTPFEFMAAEVSVFVDNERYCNRSRVYPNERTELGCGRLDKYHSKVRSVAVETRNNALRCERHVESDELITVFACWPR